MTIIDIDTINSFLHLAKDIKHNHTYYDIHVHPFEIFNPSNQKLCKMAENSLNSTTDDTNNIPKIEPIKINGTDNHASERIMNFCKTLIINKRYERPSKQIFLDHMNLSLIDNILLLPVPSEFGLVTDQLQLLSSIYVNEKRISFGGSISNDIKTAEISNFMSIIKEKYNIKIIKIHPNVTRIDTTISAGKKRIEAILSACSDLQLPVIIHGGRSTMVTDTYAQNYATIDNLEDINWGECNTNVVFAHAFCHDFDSSHVIDHVIFKLDKLCRKYDNVFFDLSNLDIKSMTHILNNIDDERFVFGSDALYEHQWAAVVKLLLSLSQTKKNIEEIFIKIISSNPSKLIFNNSNH